MDNQTDITLLQDFANTIKKKYKNAKVLLFGSQATKMNTEHSDYDIIIVAQQFTTQKTIDRGIDLYDDWKIDAPVDFICYTPKEFNRLKNKISLVKQALQEGIYL
jgi:predicted nucleotidyltransferase